MALAETRRVAGYEALNALVTGIEIASRLGNVLVRPPARGNVNLFMTSITGGLARPLLLHAFSNSTPARRPPRWESPQPRHAACVKCTAP